LLSKKTNWKEERNLWSFKTKPIWQVPCVNYFWWPPSSAVVCSQAARWGVVEEEKPWKMMKMNGTNLRSERLRLSMCGISRESSQAPYTGLVLNYASV